MADSQRVPSYAECVATILQQADRPLTLDELLDQMSALRELGAGARTAASRALSHLFQAVPVTRERYGWLPKLVTGSYIRHPLSEQEVKRGFLMLDELEHAAFFPEFFQDHARTERNIRINLLDGPSLMGTAYVERRTWSLHLGEEFAHWVDRLGGSGNDCIIIYADDAEQGEYTLRLQPHEMRDLEELKARNFQLAMTAEAIVQEDRRHRALVPTWDLAAGLLARGLYKPTTPPDEVHAVLYHFSQLVLEEGEGYKFEPEQKRRIERLTPHRNDRNHDAVDSAMRFLGWLEKDGDEPAEDWLDVFAEADLDDIDDFGAEEEYCNAYLRYLDRVSMAEPGAETLSHRDFHLVAAELEYMLALEQEFDDLLPDQIDRKLMLAERLLLDPEAISNEDLDIPDNPDYDDPPFWEN